MCDQLPVLAFGARSWLCQATTVSGLMLNSVSAVLYPLRILLDQETFFLAQISVWDDQTLKIFLHRPNSKYSTSFLPSFKMCLLSIYLC